MKKGFLSLVLLAAPIFADPDCSALVSWDKAVTNWICGQLCEEEEPTPHCSEVGCFAHVKAAVPGGSTTQSAAACQAVCQGVGYEGFLWDQDNGNCYLLNASELSGLATVEDGNDTDPLFGLKQCEGSPPTVAPTEDECYLGHLEALFIQDLSWSYSGRLDVIKNGVSAAAAHTGGKYGSARFGLASFTDKPVEPLGYPISLDYCYWLHMGLGDGMDFNLKLDGTFTRSGNDWYEDPLDAMHQAAVDPKVGWTTTATHPDGRSVRQVMVVSVNGGVHYRGDGLPHGLLDHDGGDALRCKTMDYPAVTTVAAAIAAAGNGRMKVVFLVTQVTEPHYEILAAELEGLGISAFVVVVPPSSDAAGMEAAAIEAFDVCSISSPPVRRLKPLLVAIEPHPVAPQPVAVLPSDAFDPCAGE